VAVQAFLESRIRFDQIHQVNLRTLEGWAMPQVGGLEDLLDIDREARSRAGQVVGTLQA
jgi:1-deoxy-D-xylulose-5-phosphate reductoisomerase